MEAAAHRPGGGGPGVSGPELGCASAQSPSGAPARQPCSRGRTTCRGSAACADPLQQESAFRASEHTGLRLDPPAKRGGRLVRVQDTPLNLPGVESKTDLYTGWCLKGMMLLLLLYQIIEGLGYRELTGRGWHSQRSRKRLVIS